VSRSQRSLPGHTSQTSSREHGVFAKQAVLGRWSVSPPGHCAATPSEHDAGRPWVSLAPHVQISGMPGRKRGAMTALAPPYVRGVRAVRAARAAVMDAPQ
jgi:hypothetical protein